MPRGRGGKRQGTPGQGYENRTDLMTNYAPSQPPTPSPQASPQAAAPRPAITPDMVPKLDDPTARPNQPLTEGLNANPIFAAPTPDPSIEAVRAAYAANPTPQLRAVLYIMADRLGNRMG